MPALRGFWPAGSTTPHRRPARCPGGGVSPLRTTVDCLRLETLRQLSQETIGDSSAPTVGGDCVPVGGDLNAFDVGSCGWVKLLGRNSLCTGLLDTGGGVGGDDKTDMFQ